MNDETHNERRNASPNATNKPALTSVPDFSSVIEAKRDLSPLPAEMDHRGQNLATACRGAAAMERSRIAAGLSPSEPAPWPDSTWDFLARQAKTYAK